MSELSIEYSSALEREKELSRRYEDLFTFLRTHIKESQVRIRLHTLFDFGYGGREEWPMKEKVVR